jgi:hypothetical protein
MKGHPALEVTDLRAAVAACVASGARLQQDIFLREHDGSFSAFVRDPDDNLIELCRIVKGQVYKFGRGGHIGKAGIGMSFCRDVPIVAIFSA